ncbi:nitroreductase family deazaflavin-dependent oxidoreductase [Mycobacterium sp. MYCO198283]|uniref:nitroreductase/quinone reductase family protein n=1 Tax=Mycobacterium sp. MYCO198283 TaxID=2883505 RepID=UPI001E450A74|nr:nitroreductase/quinone reductase family protein [Mycobacterium sp. MYCO198283]MCG5432336.1 nitroreductase family deazaflavin-dependent oxidoreductase [Mycobacterium sp. MYCO198283]
MAYLKPPWLTAKVFNRLAMATGVSHTVVLTVTGRRTRYPQRVPVIPVDVDGATYLVSTRGESQWVRNARARATVTLTRDGRQSRHTAVEIAAAERPPIIEAYRAAAGRAVEAYFRRLPDPADHPVFRLDPADR